MALTLLMEAIINIAQQVDEVDLTTILHSAVVAASDLGFRRCLEQWYNLHVALGLAPSTTLQRYQYADIEPAVVCVLKAFCHMCNGRVFGQNNVPSDSVSKFSADLMGIKIPHAVLDMMREVVRPMQCQGWTYYPYFALRSPQIGVAYGLGLDPLWKTVLQSLAMIPGVDPVPIEAEELQVMPMTVAVTDAIIKVDGFELPRWREIAVTALRPITAASYLVPPHPRPQLPAYVPQPPPVPVTWLTPIPPGAAALAATVPAAGILGFAGVFADLATGLSRYGSGVLAPGVPVAAAAAAYDLYSAIHGTPPLRVFAVINQGHADALAQMIAQRSWRGLPARVIVDNVAAFHVEVDRRFPSEMLPSVEGHRSMASRQFSHREVPAVGDSQRPPRGARAPHDIEGKRAGARRKRYAAVTGAADASPPSADKAGSETKTVAEHKG